MPVCTSCAHPAQYTYTTYKTKSNIRLGVCPRCDAFLDPLIEHPLLLIVLDLILLKPRVFLHLLYNRGSPPLDALSITWILAETVLRQLPSLSSSLTVRSNTLVSSSSTTDAVPAVASHALAAAKTVLIVALELATQLGTTTLLALALLYLKGWWRPVASRTPPAVPPSETISPDEPAQARAGGKPGVPIDGRKDSFAPIIIPLTLLYTSILPLLLHLLLTIWYAPPPHPFSLAPDDPDDPVPPSTLLTRYLAPSTASEIALLAHTIAHLWRTSDRVWAGTRLLGGMAAGFGLRVVLPTKPWETTGVVLAGWAAAAGVAVVMGQG